LNVSRETLQQSKLIKVLNTEITIQLILGIPIACCYY
jgi:HSP90 family molecular chaperone